MNGVKEIKDKSIDGTKSDEKKEAIGDVIESKTSKVVTETFEETYEITETTVKLKKGDNIEEIRKIINQTTSEYSNSDRKGKILIDLETITKKGDDKGDKNFILTEKSYKTLNKDGKYKHVLREIEIVKERGKSSYNNSDKIKDIRKILNKENEEIEDDKEIKENHDNSEEEETYHDKIEKIRKIINQEVTNKEKEGKILIDIEEIIRGKKTAIEEEEENIKEEKNEIEGDKNIDYDNVSDNLKLEFKEQEQDNEHGDEHEHKIEQEQDKEYRNEHGSEHEHKIEQGKMQGEEKESEHELKHEHEKEQKRQHESEHEQEQQGKKQGEEMESEYEHKHEHGKEEKQGKTRVKEQESVYEFIYQGQNKKQKQEREQEQSKEQVKDQRSVHEYIYEGKDKKQKQELEQDQNKKQIKEQGSVHEYIYQEHIDKERDKKQRQEREHEKDEIDNIRKVINQELENTPKEEGKILFDMKEIIEAEIGETKIKPEYEREHENKPEYEHKPEKEHDQEEDKDKNIENVDEIDNIRKVINQELENASKEEGKILVDIKDITEEEIAEAKKQKDKSSQKGRKGSKTDDQNLNKSKFSLQSIKKLARRASRKLSMDNSSSNKSEEKEEKLAEEIKVDNEERKEEEKDDVIDYLKEANKIEESKDEIPQDEVELIEDKEEKTDMLMNVYEFLFDGSKDNEDETISEKMRKEYCTENDELEEFLFDRKASVNDETGDKSETSQSMESLEAVMSEKTQANKNVIVQDEVQLSPKSVITGEKHAADDFDHNLNTERNENLSEKYEKSISNKEQEEETNEIQIEEIKKVINQEDTDVEDKRGKILVDLDEVIGTSDGDEMCSKKKVGNGMLSNIAITDMEDDNSEPKEDTTEEIQDSEDIRERKEVLKNTSDINCIENAKIYTSDIDKLVGEMEKENNPSWEIQDSKDISGRKELLKNASDISCIENAKIYMSEIDKLVEEMEKENNHKEEIKNDDDREDENLIDIISESLTKSILKPEITNNEGESREENDFLVNLNEKEIINSIAIKDEISESVEKKKEFDEDFSVKSVENINLIEDEINKSEDENKDESEQKKIHENKSDTDNDKDIIEEIRKTINQNENHESKENGNLLIDLDDFTDEINIKNEENEKIMEAKGEEDFKDWTHDMNKESIKCDEDKKEEEDVDHKIEKIRDIINQGITDNSLEGKILIDFDEVKHDKINDLNIPATSHFTLEHSNSHDKEMDEDMKIREQEFNRIFKHVDKEEVHNKVEEIRRIVNEETINEGDEEACLRNNIQKNVKRESNNEKSERSSIGKIDRELLHRNSVDGVLREFMAKKASFSAEVGGNDGKNLSNLNSCESQIDFCDGEKSVQGELDIDTNTYNISSSNYLQSKGGIKPNSNCVSNDNNNVIPEVKADGIATSKKRIDSGSNFEVTIMGDEFNTPKISSPQKVKDLSTNFISCSKNNDNEFNRTNNTPESSSFNINWLMPDDEDMLKSLVVERERENLDFNSQKRKSEPSGRFTERALEKTSKRKSVSFEDLPSNDDSDKSYYKNRSENLRIETLRKMKKMHEMKAFHLRKSLSYDGDDIFGVLNSRLEDEEAVSKYKLNPLDELDQMIKINSKRKSSSSVSSSSSVDEYENNSKNLEDPNTQTKNISSNLDLPSNKGTNGTEFNPRRRSLCYEGEDILKVFSNEGFEDSNLENQSKVHTVDVEVHDNTGKTENHFYEGTKKLDQNQVDSTSTTSLDSTSLKNDCMSSDAFNNDVLNSRLEDEEAVSKYKLNPLDELDRMIKINSKQKSSSPVSSSSSVDEDENNSKNLEDPKTQTKNISSNLDLPSNKEANGTEFNPRRRSLCYEGEDILKVFSNEDFEDSNLENQSKVHTVDVEVHDNTGKTENHFYEGTEKHDQNQVDSTSTTSLDSTSLKNDCISSDAFNNGLNNETLLSDRESSKDSLNNADDEKIENIKNKNCEDKSDNKSSDSNNSSRENVNEKVDPSIIGLSSSYDEKLKIFDTPIPPLRKRRYTSMPVLNATADEIDSPKSIEVIAPPRKRSLQRKMNNKLSGTVSCSLSNITTYNPNINFLEEIKSDAKLKHSVDDLNLHRHTSPVSFASPEVSTIVHERNYGMRASVQLLESPLGTGSESKPVKSKKLSHTKKKSYTFTKGDTYMADARNKIKKKKKHKSVSSLFRRTFSMNDVNKSNNPPCLPNLFKRLRHKKKKDQCNLNKLPPITEDYSLQNSNTAESFASIFMSDEEEESYREKCIGDSNLERSFISLRFPDHGDNSLQRSMSSVDVSKYANSSVKKSPLTLKKRTDILMRIGSGPRSLKKKLKRPHIKNLMHDTSTVSLDAEALKKARELLDKTLASKLGSQKLESPTPPEQLQSGKSINSQCSAITENTGKIVDKEQNNEKIVIETPVSKFRKDKGFRGSLKSMFSSEKKSDAVKRQLSFSLPGENQKSEEEHLSSSELAHLADEHKKAEKVKLKFLKKEAENLGNISQKIHALHDSQEEYHERVMRKFIRRYSQDIQSISNSEGKLEELTNKYRVPLQDDLEKIQKIASKEILGVENIDDHPRNKLNLFDSEHRREASYLNDSDSSPVSPSTGTSNDELDLSYEDLEKLDKESSRKKSESMLGNSKYQVFRFPYINREKTDDDFPMNKETLIKECLDGTINLRLKNIVKDSEEMIDPDVLETDSTDLLALQYEKEIYKHMRENFNSSNAVQDLDVIERLASIYEEELLSHFNVKGKNFLKLASSEITKRRASIINLEMLMDTKLNKQNLIRECLDGTLNIKLQNVIRENDKILDPNRLETDTTKILALEYEKEILQHMRENFDIYDENEELETIRKLCRIYEDGLLSHFDVKGENFLKLADKEITQRRGSVINLKRISELLEEYGSSFQSESDESDSEISQVPRSKRKVKKNVSIDDSSTIITNSHPPYSLISDLERESEGSGVSTPTRISEKYPDHLRHKKSNTTGYESLKSKSKRSMNKSIETSDIDDDRENFLEENLNKDIATVGNEYEDEILAHAFRLSLQRHSSAPNPKVKRLLSQSENKFKNTPKFSFQSMKNNAQGLFKNVRRYSSPILTKALSLDLPRKNSVLATKDLKRYAIDHPIIEGIVTISGETYPKLPEWVKFQPLTLAKLASNVYFGNKKHDMFSKMMNTSESINRFLQSASLTNTPSADEDLTPTSPQPSDNPELSSLYRGVGPAIHHIYVARSNSLITYESSPPPSPVSVSGEEGLENQDKGFRPFGLSRSPIPQDQNARHFPYENKENIYDRKSLQSSSSNSFDSLLNDNEIKNFLDKPKNIFSSSEETFDKFGKKFVQSPLSRRKFIVSPVPSDSSFVNDDIPDSGEKAESSADHYFKPIKNETSDFSSNKVSVKRAYLNTKPIQRSFAVDINSDSLSDSRSITSQDSDTTFKTGFSKSDSYDGVCEKSRLTNLQAEDEAISKDKQPQTLTDGKILNQELQDFEITTELSVNNQLQDKSLDKSNEDFETSSQSSKDFKKFFENQRVPTIEVSEISSANDISFEKSDVEDFSENNVPYDDNISEKLSDSSKVSGNEVRPNESFDSLSSSDNEIKFRPISEDTNIIKEKCSLNCECELHSEDSDHVKILAVHEKLESPDYILRTWYERQEIPEGFTTPSPVIIPNWVKNEEAYDDTAVYRKDTPSPAPPTDKVARSPPLSPDEVDSKKEEDRIQKDRCVEIYPETIRQRQRNMTPSPSKVDIKNWEPAEEDGKKFLPSVKALRNQFENGKSKSDNTLVRTPSDSSSANSLVLTSLDTSSGFGSLTSSQAIVEPSPEGPKSTPREDDEPVEPIFSQFREVDEEFKEMMSKPPSTQGWDPQPLLKRLYYVPDAPKMHRREVPFVNIEGYLEKLPSGRKKATFWNAWKRRYFAAKDGILYYYQNNQGEKPNMKLSLIGGKIEIMDPNMISVEDGSRESRMAGMLGIDDGKGHYVVVRCPSRQEAERWKDALETHTYDDFTSQYVQPWPRPTNPTLLRDTLVIDIGSCSVRAGVLASQPTLPQVFFPSVVATNRETKAQIWGIEALMPDIRPTSSISFPIRPSHKISKFSVDLNAVSSLLQKTFNDLKVDPKNYNIQLSVPRVLNPHTQAELLKILFDKFGVKSVNMTHQSILALYAYNATSGIIVDIGERLDVVPVIDGYIVDGGVSRVPYGGYRITDHLRQFLFQKNISLINEIDSYIIRMILESICYCAQHYNTEKQRCTMNPENFEKMAPLAEFFPEDLRFDAFRNLSLDFGRFQATEGLFNPDAWGLDHPGLHKLVHKAIQECSMDIRRELSRSIFLVGGVSQLPGIVDRLTVEIDNLTPPAIRPKVHASPYRYHASFLGACILAESDAFDQSKITKEEWTKQGNSSLRKWAL